MYPSKHGYVKEALKSLVVKFLFYCNFSFQVIWNRVFAPGWLGFTDNPTKFKNHSCRHYWTVVCCRNNWSWIRQCKRGKIFVTVAVSNCFLQLTQLTGCIYWAMYLCDDVVKCTFFVYDVQKFLVWLSNYQIFKKNCWLEFPLMVGNAGLLPNLFDIDACRHYVPFLSLQKSVCLKYKYMYAVIPLL